MNTSTKKPKTHCADLARLPRVLRPLTEERRWVNWSWTARQDGNGNLKWTKPPLQASDPGRSAKSNDPATWDSYEHALQRWRDHEADGIGYMLLGSAKAAADLDHCCRHDSAARKVQIEPWARALREQADGAYCEVTVSGTGMRLIGTADGARVHRRFNKIVDGDPDAHIELFRDAERFITISGIALSNGSTLPSLDPFIDKVLADYDGRGSNKNEQRQRRSRHDYEDLIRNGAAEGERSDLFHAVVWHLAAKGWSSDQIVDELARYPNGIAAKYADRLQDEVERSYGKWQQEPPLDADESIQDLAATAFAEQHADDLRFVAIWNKWMQWDGARWQKEETKLAFDQARAVLKEYGKVRNSEVAAVLSLASADRLLAASSQQWDSDPWQLGTPAGTVDLRTGELRTASPHDYMTNITAVAPDRNGRCPRWQQFLKEVTKNDDELIRYLQRVSGYALTGDISEEALFFIYGTGGNGKGVFLGTLHKILGDYAKAAAMETFVVTKSDKHPTDLAGLRGARLVTATETEEGRRWDETKIKTMTGGDVISARLMRQDFFEFTPQFKLWISGNHKPKISSVDEAIRRRMNLLPFTVTIPPEQRDPELKEKLKVEWPGILWWVIEGCMMWQQQRLSPPKTVVDATADYLESEDTLATWIEECCLVRKDTHEQTSMLWDSWRCWAERAGEYLGSQKWFSSRMEDRGFELDKRLGQRCIVGLRLTDVERAAHWRRKGGSAGPMGGKPNP
jgi:putative DNA primase/helicase